MDINPNEEDKVGEAERYARLQKFADALVVKRDEAIEFKRASGVEEDWDEDDGYYNAIDPFAIAEKKWQKGRNTTDGLTQRPTGDSGSDVFDNITAYYTDMAAGGVTDMLTPVDERPFRVKPTPMQDLVDAKQDTQLISAPGAQPMPANQIAESIIAEAKKCAETAEKWIWDKFIQCNWHAEFRKVLERGAMIGTGVIKGPVPVRRRFKAWDDATQTFVDKEVIEPSSREINPRNLFPDPACCEDIQRGSYIWERDEITYRQLRELKGMTLSAEAGQEPQPMYLDSQIDLCLEEGPTDKQDKTKKYEPKEKDRFEIWYGYCTADAKDMEAAGFHAEEGETIAAQITMVNDRVIQATESHLSEGEFPYDVFVWKRKPGTPWGTGVSRQVRVPQRQVNGYERAIMRNAGLASGAIILIRENKVYAADGGEMAIRPNMILAYKDDSDVTKASDIIQAITIPSLQKELMEGILFWLARAEKISGLERQQQGQPGENPETLGGRVILQNNANTLKRRIARQADDGVIEPHVKRYYSFWLKYSEDEKKGADNVIEALGSTALYERDAQSQFLMQLGPYSKDPAYGLKPREWMTEILKGNRYDPSRVQMSDEEWQKQQEAAAQQPQPVAPQIEVAKLRAESAEKIQTIRSEEAVQKVTVDTDRDRVLVESQAARTAEIHQYNMEKLALEREIALMKENGESARQIENLKVELAKLTMELTVQKELSTRSQSHDMAKHVTPQITPTKMEPVGRADPGRAFEQ